MGSLSSVWLRSSGASDVNETMNKPTKNSYAATNRRIDLTGPQLLSARAPAQISSNTSAENNDVTLKSYIEMQEKGVELKKTTYELSTFSVAQEDHTEQESARIENMFPGLHTDDVDSILSEDTCKSSAKQSWRTVNFIKFNAVFPWMNCEYGDFDRR